MDEQDNPESIKMAKKMDPQVNLTAHSTRGILSSWTGLRCATPELFCGQVPGPHMANS